jgi:DNA-binding IclR family transcriptional regulator
MAHQKAGKGPEQGGKSVAKASSGKPRGDERSASGNYATLQGVGRAMAVLEELAEHPMTATDLMTTMGLKWATGYRTLAYLEDNGFLRRDNATGIYYVGPRLYHIGSSYGANLPIIQAARPYLKTAVDQTSATAQLVERDGFRSIALMVFEPRSEYIPRTAIGYHQPLHCGSRGQVLLAHEDPGFVEQYLARPLEAFTPHTVTDPDELREILVRIREQGYAVTKRDVQLFTASVASPVRDASGTVIASITLIVNYSEIGGKEPHLANVAAEVAQSISLVMGWRPMAVERRARLERLDTSPRVPRGRRQPNTSRPVDIS